MRDDDETNVLINRIIGGAFAVTAVLLVVLLALLAGGCVPELRPVPVGDVVNPPAGCLEGRGRGVEC
jgi:hypothetical protein